MSFAAKTVILAFFIASTAFLADGWSIDKLRYDAAAG
jgi:hypothetical protein